jgi:hypothetical protein
VREVFFGNIGMNKKGGMLNEEFDKYVEIIVCPLSPEDWLEKRMLLKVGSSPGCDQF